MKNHHLFSWALSIGLIGLTFSANLNAEVLFQDEFDQVTIERVPTRLTTDSVWTLNRGGGRFSLRPTTAELGGGVANISTQENYHGGMATAVHPELDFFDQELTYTFSGFDIQALGISRIPFQSVRLAILAVGGSRIWGANSHILVEFSGAGRFDVVVVEKDPAATGTGLETIEVKDFKSYYFNFDVTKLQKVEISLDDTYYRVSFIFETVFDQFSFGGEHHLSRDRWLDDTVGLGRALSNLVRAENSLAAAIDSGVQADIDAAQALLLTRQGEYDATNALADPLKGDVALLVSAGSADASQLLSEYGIDSEVGASLTVDSVKVETSNILQQLITP